MVTPSGCVWEVQLSVAGRPREETVGTVLPEGWQLAQVRSPIPVLVDEQGRLRAQVRPGQWQVHLDAFRIGRKEELQFGSDARHPGGVVLIGLQANPAFRVVELEGGDQVDASQTRFPERWRGLPVYRWDTRRVLRIVERMRGQGSGPTRRLTLQREWWLDEDGRALTFRDVIAGNGQTLWRLDVAEGVELGSARLGEERLLLTRNPLTGRAGFELRVREFAAECVGRQPVRGPMSATGWMVSADELSGVLHLPVGWRLLALWGRTECKGTGCGSGRCWTCLVCSFLFWPCGNSWGGEQGRWRWWLRCLLITSPGRPAGLVGGIGLVGPAASGAHGPGRTGPACCPGCRTAVARDCPRAIRGSATPTSAVSPARMGPRCGSVSP
jgi:hypothetical protein